MGRNDYFVTEFEFLVFSGMSPTLVEASRGRQRAPILEASTPQRTK